MRFIQIWAFECADFLTIRLGENHQKRNVYYYGLQIIIGSILKFFLLLTTSLLLGIFRSTLITVSVFSTFRMFVGGYHMDSYGKCIMVSFGLFIVAGLIGQYTYVYWSFPFLIGFISLVFCGALFIIIKYAPKDNPHKPITNPAQIRKFKILSICYICAWLAVTLFLVYQRSYLYSIIQVHHI